MADPGAAGSATAATGPGAPAGVVNFSAEQVEELRGQLDRTNRRMVVFDRRLARFEAQESDAPPWTGAGGPGVADFLSQTRGSPGIIVDQAVAREPTPCLCYEIASRSGHSQLCFHHGIVGALDRDQIDTYCQTREERPPTPEQRARLEAFQESADTCKAAIQEVPKGEELEPWLACMSSELRARGRALSGVPTVDAASAEPDQIPVAPTAMPAGLGFSGEEATASSPHSDPEDGGEDSEED